MIDRTPLARMLLRVIADGHIMPILEVVPLEMRHKSGIAAEPWERLFYYLRCGRNFEPALIGSSKRLRSARAVCAAIFGMRRISRAVVSSTVNFHPLPKKKNTIRALSRAARSWGLVRM